MKAKLQSRKQGRRRLRRRPSGLAVVAGLRPETGVANPPARWRWHLRTLLSLRDRLLREQRNLRDAAAQPLEPHSLDEADSATDEFDHALALSGLAAEQNALCEVNEALRRIADGSYGVCEESGVKIPAARLRAVPWTRFTREVEERLEKKGLLRGPSLPAPGSVRASGQVWLAPEEEAEEVEQPPPTPPNDEMLAGVLSPPGRHATSKRDRNPTRRPARRKERPA